MDKCKYKFQDKEKFNGKLHCVFFDKPCAELSFICDKNCEVFEQDKRIEELENLLNLSEQHSKEVIEQNQSLQKELMPFRERYFENLSTSVIAELAKSQIKTTAHNIEVKELLDYIYKTTTNAGPENAIRIIRQSIEKYREKHNGN